MNKSSKLIIPDVSNEDISTGVSTIESSASSTSTEVISGFQSTKGMIYDYLLMIFTTFVTPVLFILSILCFTTYFVAQYVFNYELPDHFLTGGCVLFYFATCNYCYFNQNQINQENKEANNI